MQKVEFRQGIRQMIDTALVCLHHGQIIAAASRLRWAAEELERMAQERERAKAARRAEELQHERR